MQHDNDNDDDDDVSMINVVSINNDNGNGDDVYRAIAADQEAQKAYCKQELLEVCELLSANDPNEREVDMYEKMGTNYGDLLGTALQTNTHMVSLRLDLGPLYQYENYDKLVTVIRTHTNLRKVGMYDEDDAKVEDNGAYRQAYNSLLEAVSLNPRIEDLDLLSSPPGPALAAVLQASSKIKSLELWNCDFLDIPHEAALVVSALQENTTLEKLRLQFVWDAGSLLVALKAHPTLRELDLHGGEHEYASDGTMDGLVALLQGTVQLRSLALEGYKFTKADTKKLVSGLSVHQSLTSLSLVQCKFKVNATLAFMGYLRNETTSSYAVRELKIAPFTETFRGMKFGSDDTVADLWEHTLRRNCSLHKFDTFTFRKAQWAKIHLFYSMRNFYLPQLVAHQPLIDDYDASKTPTPVFPLLFAAAQQSPRITATTILSGLLSLSTTVGPPPQSNIDMDCCTMLTAPAVPNKHKRKHFG